MKREQLKQFETDPDPIIQKLAVDYIKLIDAISGMTTCVKEHGLHSRESDEKWEWVDTSIEKPSELVSQLCYDYGELFNAFVDMTLLVSSCGIESPEAAHAWRKLYDLNKQCT